MLTSLTLSRRRGQPGPATRGSRSIAAVKRPVLSDRRRWLSRLRDSYPAYWPDTSQGAEIALQDRALRGRRGRVFRGVVQDERRRRVFCVKWCPEADPDALETTFKRMKWWRACHPELAGCVVDILGVWPDEQVMLLDWCAGSRLGGHLRQQLPLRHDRAMSRKPPGRHEAAKTRRRTGLRHLDADRLGTELGEWLRRFAAGRVKYDPDVDSSLGLSTQRQSDGRLIVDARRLLEQRIERGERAARTLHGAGLSSAASWADRFDLDAIIESVSREEPGGFIHGDFKPDNILVHGDGWSVIDWWTTPRVSWPLADVATFAGNLWFYGTGQVVDRLWRTFTSAYYADGCDEQTLQTIDLVSTIMRLAIIAEKLQQPVIGKRLARRWCKRLVNRPSLPTYDVAHSCAGDRCEQAERVRS